MRAVLHADLNSCYASIECLHRPELRHLPVAVGGDPEARHGVILAKNQLAKRSGVRTGEAIWQARQKCPELIVLPPNFPLYLQFCRAVLDLYYEYSDQVEPFGMDEAWLDVTGSRRLCGEPAQIADELRRRVKRELGLTISVGVSYNKVFAKLGSDLKKPDAVTVISPENYRELVWPLPVGELIFVGRATAAKLAGCGIHTIGELAAASPDFLRGALGKNGALLHCYARGEDRSPVLRRGEQAELKSVSHSTTTPRDIETEQDAEVVLAALCETVGRRLRECGFQCSTLQIELRDTGLAVRQHQTRLPVPTNITRELTATAFALFRESCAPGRPLRSLGVKAAELLPANCCCQTSLFVSEQRKRKLEKLDATADALCRRFGKGTVVHAISALDRELVGSPMPVLLPKDGGQLRA